MLKLNFLTCLRGLLPVLFLAGSVVATAQQLQPAPWNDPAIVWLTPQEAQVKLQAELQVLQPQLASLGTGTPPHTDLLRRIIFYKAMLRAVIAEWPVRQAIDLALPEAASLGGLYEQHFTPEATLRALYDEALALLTD